MKGWLMFFFIQMLPNAQYHGEINLKATIYSFIGSSI